MNKKKDNKDEFSGEDKYVECRDDETDIAETKLRSSLIKEISEILEKTRLIKSIGSEKKQVPLVRSNILRRQRNPCECDDAVARLFGGLQCIGFCGFMCIISLALEGRWLLLFANRIFQVVTQIYTVQIFGWEKGEFFE